MRRGITRNLARRRKILRSTWRSGRACGSRSRRGCASGAVRVIYSSADGQNKRKKQEEENRRGGKIRGSCCERSARWSCGGGRGAKTPRGAAGRRGGET